MNFKILKKVIFLFFLLINFIPSGKVSGLNKIKYKKNNQTNLTSWSKFYSDKRQISNPNPRYLRNLFTVDYSDKVEKTFNNDLPLILAILTDEKDELVIESEVQSEINNILYAEGNVNVSYKGKYLKADNLIYDKPNKKISAKGNVSLVIGEQIFKLSQFEYNFISKKGYLLDVKGSINTDKLIEDLFANFSNSDNKRIENLLDLKKKEVLNTPNKVENWIFFADRITINDQKWKSKKALFTNDLLELKQVKIQINSLEVIPRGEELRFKSGLNYLILDEKVSIPLWFVDRTLTKSGGMNYKNDGWTIGYDNLDKDGYFIGRNFSFLDLLDDFVLNVEPQFLIQRSLNGYTKSFVKNGDSITGDKVKRDTTFVDYFALKSQIKGKVENWDLEIEKRLNSFDTSKLSDAFRFKTYLSKEINFLDSRWNKSFYGVYRDRVWNGSIGEAEIYTGYGSKLEKQNTWEVNGITKTEVLSFGVANLKAEALETKNLVTSLKGNLFYSLDQKFPIIVDRPKNKIINSSYEYISEPISKGLNLNTRVAASYSLYENAKHQEFIGFGLGPELIFGNFKNKIFDYTRVSFFPFYKIKSGESLFKFDQISDKFTLNIDFDQQLFGPLVLKTNGTLNLDTDTEDYGEFINSKISLNWKKRSFECGIFYQPHNQSGGISFNLYGFK